jgi:sporulation protein YlmC with PRC-barrel domain
MNKKILLLIIAISLVLNISFAFATLNDLSSNSPDDEWWMLGHDTGYTRFTTANAPANISDTTVTTFNTNNDVTGTPIIVENSLFIHPRDFNSANLYELNALNISQSITNSTNTYSLDGRGITYYNDFIYMHSDANLLQINASNLSQQIDTEPIGDFGYYATPTVFNGSVYIGTGNSNPDIDQFNVTNISDVISTFNSGSRIYVSTPVLGLYAYGASSGAIYQFNFSNLGNTVYSKTCYANGIEYTFPVSEDYVYKKCTLGNGSSLHLAQFNSSNVSMHIANFSAGGYDYALGNGWLYFSSSGVVYQLNATNISHQFANFTMATSSNDPVVATQDYLFVSAGSVMYQLDASNISQSIGSYTAGGAINGPPIVAKGFLYFGSDDNNLYQLGISDPLSSVTISYPANGSVHYNITNLNYTAKGGISGNSCWSSTDGGQTNSTTVDPGTNFTDLQSVEGQNNWTVYCNDSENTLFFETTTFTMDTERPSFNPIENQSIIFGSSLSYNVNATDNVGLSCFTVNDTINFVINCSGTLQNNGTIEIGFYPINITINDSANNKNSAIMSVNITPTIPPGISFVSPTPANGYSSANTSIQINFSIIEPSMNEFTYNWNGTNYTIYNDSLVLMMNFDNLSSLGENSTFVVDLSRSSNNGTINGPVFNSTGKYNGAYEFDGANDEITSSTTFGIGIGNFSVSAWVNLDSTSESGSFIKIGGTSPNVGFAIGTGGSTFDNSGNDLILLYEGVRWIDTNDNIGTGWHHVAMTVNKNGYPEAYIDGVQTYSDTTGVGSSPQQSITYIGGYTGSAAENRHADVTLDEIRIWNRSLTAQEIYQLYASNLNKFNLTHWYLYVNQSQNATTELADGEYTFYAYVENNNGTSNQTDLRTLTVNTTDITAPEINITFPLNITYTSTIAILNYTYSDLNPDSCWQSSNNGTTNSSTVSAGTNFTGLISSVGSNNWTLYCNDSSGNENSTFVTFNVTTLPQTTIDLAWNSPLDFTNVSQDEFFNVTVNITCRGGDCGEINVTLDPPAIGTVYNFTTCETTGRTGPSQADCDTNYSGTTLEGLVNVSGGIQNWTVPATGIYTIEVAGAQGGMADSPGTSVPGGKGAIIKGDFTLTEGDTILIIVGQEGGLHDTYGGGGGGGTYVTTDPNYSLADPHIVAGGGGGGGYTGTDFSNASFSTNGSSGGSGGGGSSGGGGEDGNGGTSDSAYGGGGGGFYTSGSTDAGGGSGKGFRQGGEGAAQRTGGLPGFGGGGAAHGGAGGGGGYSGGGGGDYSSSTNYAFGGGGGSVNNGTNQKNISIANTGEGYVTITFSGGAKGGVVSTTVGTTPFYTNVTNPYNLTLNQDESATIIWWVNATGDDDASFLFFAYANQTSNETIGNITSMFNITIQDTTFPRINITFPLNQTYTVDINQLNYTYSDENSDSCWYSIDGGITNSTTVSAGTNFTSVSSSIGSNTWTLYCNDTSNNQNATSITFGKEIAAIGLELISPKGNINATQNDTFDVTVNISCIGSDCGEINVSLDPAAQPVSCKEILDLGQSTGDGVYSIYPHSNSTSYDVYCDMSTDDGGWTLVASRYSIAMEDKAVAYHDNLTTLTPSDSSSTTDGIWDGMRDVSNTTYAHGNSTDHIRFSCITDVSNNTLRVDLAFYNIHWYHELTNSTTESSVCFEEGNGAGDTQPAPARKNLITNDSLPLGNDWNANGYLEGEDSCGPDTDFTVDFDDRGMDSNQNDGTDWGEDDGSDKCGSATTSTGAWHIWFKESTNYTGSTKSGLISTTDSDTPFFTNLTNPYNITLNQDESYIITWAVNATGELWLNHTFFVYANITNDQSTGNITQVWNVTIVNFSVDYNAPIISISAPSNDSGLTQNVSFNFTLIETNISSCSLIFNHINNQTNSSINASLNQSFSLYQLKVGSYNWSINCTDDFDNIGSSETRTFAVIQTSGFTGLTTDLTQVNISNITNLIIENPEHGMFNFTGAVDLSDGADFEKDVNISFNRIELNSTSLPALNITSRLSLYNLTFTNPRVLRDESICNATICTELNYSDATLIFNVTSFTIYSTEETPEEEQEVEEGGAGGTGGGGGPGGRSPEKSKEKPIIEPECYYDIECNIGYSCYNNECVKLFDIEILSLEPKVEELSFELEYLIKGMAEIKGDVIIKFRIQDDNQIIELGQDAIYLGSFEEKIKNTNLNLPQDLPNGVYDLYVQLNFENYQVEAFRKVNINLPEEIILVPDLSPEQESLLSYFWWILIIVGTILGGLIISFAKRVKSVSNIKYIGKYACLSSMRGKAVYSNHGNIIGYVEQPLLSNQKVTGWIIIPNKEYKFKKKFLIQHKDVIAIKDVFLVHEHIEKYFERHGIQIGKKHKRKFYYNSKVIKKLMRKS